MAFFRPGRAFYKKRIFRGRSDPASKLVCRRLLVERLEDRRLLSVTAELVKDINVAETGSDASPIDLFPVGNLVYFTARDPAHGSELWRTDGTDEGTFRLTESNSSPGRPFIHLTEVKGAVFFANSTSEYGRELWKTDGTVAGTTLVTDIAPGEEDTRIGRPVAVGHRLFFVVDDDIHGIELWSTDGTPEGTHLVADINKGPESSIPQEFFEYRGLLVFIADDGIHGLEYWVSDGTGQGTRLLHDSVPGPGDFNESPDLTIVGGTLFFDTASGLWKTDGTPEGTSLLREISASRFLAVDDILYFTGNDGVHGRQLWRSNGTEEGTYMVRAVRPDGESSRIESLTDVDGTLFFSADDGIHGRELWKSDGTAEGTVLVKDIHPGENDSGPSSITPHNGLIFFIAQDERFNSELWKSDGTEAGTVLVKDIAPGRSEIRYLTDAGGWLFFAANDGVHGLELWRTDGTADGTIMLRDIRPGELRSIWQGGLTPNRSGQIFFRADDGTHGDELWVSDGSEAGTYLVHDINRATDNSSPFPLMAFGGAAVFSASNPSDGGDLWTSDGTTEGTRRIVDFAPGSEGNVTRDITVFDDRLFFVATEPDHGREMWLSDGTQQGTMLLKDIYPGNADSMPVLYPRVEFVPLDGYLYFAADDGVHGRELWRTDGTEEHTMMVRDLWPGEDSSLPAELVVMNNALFFRARDSDGSNKLWRSDGTPEGTVQLKDAQIAGLPHIFPTVVGDALFFRAPDEEIGQELWKTDGTVAGTVLVKDIRTVPHPLIPYRVGSYPYGLTNVNGTLFFSADDGVHGKELWKSDGTEAGTVMVRDINPRFSYCQYGVLQPAVGCDEPIKYLTEVDGTLFYSADDGQHGRELWRSDGTEEGTFMVADISSGPMLSFEQSLPNRLLNINGTLVFTAWDGENTLLFRSDGTEDGTFPLSDIEVPMPWVSPRVNNFPLARWNEYQTAVRLATTLLFASDEDLYGRELWRIPLTPGDTNLDFVVDQTDLDNVRNHFGQTGDNLPGDTNADGRVDIDDLNAVRNHFGAGASTEPAEVEMTSHSSAVDTLARSTRETRQRFSAVVVDRLFHTFALASTTDHTTNLLPTSGSSSRTAAAESRLIESTPTSSGESVRSSRQVPKSRVDALSGNTVRRFSRGHQVQEPESDDASVTHAVLADWLGDNVIRR